jgi:hypothetical protein
MPALQEHQIQTILANLTLAATLLTIGFTFSLVVSKYRRAGRYFSTRQGGRRRRLVILFLGLAAACFFVVTALKYVDSRARAEVVHTLAGGLGDDGYKDEEPLMRSWWGDGDEEDEERLTRSWWGDGDEEDAVQVEVPSA